ncbi:hypothetical protein ANO14919_137620 [Xylariales sp. No.14919]|nr:hypothetical protein ANO14919_137620 [Xylariales sp. No.14919]
MEWNITPAEITLTASTSPIMRTTRTETQKSSTAGTTSNTPSDQSNQPSSSLATGEKVGISATVGVASLVLVTCLLITAYRWRKRQAALAREPVGSSDGRIERTGVGHGGPAHEWKSGEKRRSRGQFEIRRN